MTENSGFGLGIGFALGILVGGFFTYIILKSKSAETLTPKNLDVEKLYTELLKKRLNES